MSNALRHTPLHDAHVALGARMVPFAGWDMPLHYGSQLREHTAARTDAVVFDVSHMQVFDARGAGAAAFLRYLLANDVEKLAVDGAALYTCMLNERGGVLDDLIVYRVRADHYRIVVNAGTADSDWAWMDGERRRHARDCDLMRRPDLSILAVQGPHARAKCEAACPATRAAAHLARFHGTGDSELWIARTGYTGEDGYEIILPSSEAAGWWRALLDAGVAPAGLGARDTLRLEAGLNLYGQDMDEAITPMECGLAWTVVLAGNRDFVGKRALLENEPRYSFHGVVLLDKGVMRGHQPLRAPQGEEIGRLTSAGYAPTLDASIGLARTAEPCAAGAPVEVLVRDRWLPARIVKPPFVRGGRAAVNLSA